MLSSIYITYMDVLLRLFHHVCAHNFRFSVAAFYSMEIVPNVVKCLAVRCFASERDPIKLGQGKWRANGAKMFVNNVL